MCSICLYPCQILKCFPNICVLKVKKLNPCIKKSQFSSVIISFERSHASVYNSHSGLSLCVDHSQYGNSTEIQVQMPVNEITKYMPGKQFAPYSEKTCINGSPPRVFNKINCMVFLLSCSMSQWGIMCIALQKFASLPSFQKKLVF